MSIEFDYQKYTELMDDFIIKMEQIPSENHPDIHKTMKPLCDFLRIGRFEASITESFGKIKNINDKSEPQILSTKFYDSEQPYLDSCISFSRQVANGDLIQYKIYPVLDQPEWSETERKKIEALITLIFSFNGRARVSRIATEMTFTDKELNVNTFAYFMKNASILYSSKQISLYCGCFFNFRGFSIINAQLGREAGTRVMRLFLDGLVSQLEGLECVGRIGGDNFVILFRKEKLKTIMDYLESRTIEINLYGIDKITVCTYAGYFMADENSNPVYLMDRLSIAQNIARSVLKVPYVFFNEELKAKIDESKNIENMFGEALENEEFMVYYQPKVSLEDFSLIGAEALCRWNLNGKIIQPCDFIPTLEKSHYICMLDFYMLEHVCQDLRRWIDSGLNVVKISVNLSRVHLGNINILEKIIGIIDKYNIPHQYIEIELTETTTDVDFTDLKQLVNSLHKNEISTSVDDFGVGYSSLNLIRDLPWNVLKIDKSFLPDEISDKNTKTQSQKEAMLNHIIAMAKTFGLDCISEGVETKEQIELLKNCMCQNAQGFYFDKPLPVKEFEKRLYQYNNHIPCYPVVDESI